METHVGDIESSYEIMRKAGEGTFSEVVKGRRLDTGTKVAIKRMKGKFSGAEQVDKLREVQALRRLKNHKNIIEMEAVVFNPDARTLDLVFELMDMNIYERIKGRRNPLPEELIKSYMYQLCKGLDHMHRNGIFHRDIKPENILIRDEVLKIADLGSCRGVHSKPPFTEYISTRWYRAPECLLTNGYYGYKMDIWSVGCVMFEVMNLYPLFPGSNELDQINRIHDIMGTPEADVFAKIRSHSSNMKVNFPEKKGKGLRSLMPNASDDCVNLLEGLLIYDPSERFSARQALKHPYLQEQRAEDKRRHRAAQKERERAAQQSEKSLSRAVSIKDPQQPEDDAQLRKYRSFKARRMGSKKLRSIKKADLSHTDGSLADQLKPTSTAMLSPSPIGRTGSTGAHTTTTPMSVVHKQRVRRGHAASLKEQQQATALPPIAVGGRQLGRSFTLHHHGKVSGSSFKR